MDYARKKSIILLFNCFGRKNGPGFNFKSKVGSIKNLSGYSGIAIPNWIPLGFVIHFMVA